MKPRLINNSKVPVILSVLSPIEIWAVTIGPWIFCRGIMSIRDVNHESIHVWQYSDLLYIGFLVIYAWDYLHGLIKYRNDISGTDPYGHAYTSLGEKAYFRTRAEQEAYSNDGDMEYLDNRKKREWLSKYKV